MDNSDGEQAAEHEAFCLALEAYEAWCDANGLEYLTDAGAESTAQWDRWIREGGQ